MDISDIHRHLEVGFASMRGKLDILVQRADQQDRTWAEYQYRMDQELRRRDQERLRDLEVQEARELDHESRLRQIEMRVYIAASAAVSLAGVMAHFIH